MERLPEPLRTQKLLDGIRILLPSRKVVKTPVAGLILMLMALFMMGFLGFWIRGVWSGDRSLPLFARAVEGFMALGGVLGLAVTLLMFLGGIWLLVGSRCEIDVTKRHLKFRERSGPFWWTRRFRRDRILGLSIEPSEFLVVRRLGRAAALGAFCYPTPWLQAIASELGRQMGPIELELTPGEAPLRKPDFSLIEVVEEPGRVILRIPPAGFGCGAIFALLFALIWTGFSVFLFGLMVWPDGPQRIPMAAMGLLFVTVGFWLAAYTIERARKRARITLTDAELEIFEEGPFRRRCQKWNRKGLSVTCHDLKYEVNDVRQFELRIAPPGGRPVGMLRGRSEPELEWIVSVLRGDPKVEMSAAPVPPPVSKPAGVTEELLVELPAAGVFRPQKNGALTGALVLPVFSIIALAVLFIFFPGFGRSFVIMPVTLGFFILIGAIVVAWVLNTRLQKGSIRLTRDGLEVVQESPFRRERFRIPLADIRGVQAVKTGGSTNNVEEYELRIEQADGSYRSCFSKRDPGELARLATLLRERIKG